MELKEKLGLLNEQSSVMQIQEYIKDMKKDRVEYLYIQHPQLC